jgi:hypothetical protein
MVFMLSTTFRSWPQSLSSNFRSLLRSFPVRGMSTRSYREALDALNSLQSNAATLEALRASGGRSDYAIPEMIEYLERIGYFVSVHPDSFCVLGSSSMSSPVISIDLM